MRGNKIGILLASFAIVCVAACGAGTVSCANTNEYANPNTEPDTDKHSNPNSSHS